MTTPDVGLPQTEISPVPLFETGWKDGPTGHLSVIGEKPDGFLRRGIGAGEKNR